MYAFFFPAEGMKGIRSTYTELSKSANESI